MKKHVILILIVLSWTALIFGVSFAWFTHTQSRQVVKLTAHEIEIITYANEQIVFDSIVINDLVVIDIENDFVLNKYQALEDVATILEFKVTLSTLSPQSRHFVSLNYDVNQLIVLLLYTDGLLFNKADISAHILNISEAIDLYGMSIALDNHYQHHRELISDVIIEPGDSLTFYLVAWGLYDAIVTETIDLMLSIDTRSYVGGP